MLFMILVLTLSIAANAAEVKVLDMPVWGSKIVNGEFGFNEELGRVWVEISVDETFNNESTPDYYRVKLDELVYEATSQKAVLTVDGQAFECAALRKRGILFRHNYLKTTGCAFKSKTVKVQYDDGFEIQTRTHLQVFLVTK